MVAITFEYKVKKYDNINNKNLKKKKVNKLHLINLNVQTITKQMEN